MSEFPTESGKLMNREAWLNKMARMLRPWYSDHGFPLKGDLVVTMSTMKDLGVCIEPARSYYDPDNRKALIFVSAFDGIHGDERNVIEVCSTLTHELLHAALPPAEGHGKLWRHACREVGLELKVNPVTGRTIGKYAGAGKELRTHINALLKHMPPLPEYGLRKPVKVVGEDGEGAGKMVSMRYQCSCCKLACVLTFTAMVKGGVPPCWNTECPEHGRPMQAVKMKKGR